MLSVSIVTLMLQSHGQYSISRLGSICQSADILQHVWLLLITGPNPSFRTFLSPKKAFMFLWPTMGSGGLKSVWLNTGFSSSLTPQMDLIVLRNSIFCRSACTLCVPAPRPPRGPAAASVASYQQHSGCAEMRSQVQTAGRGERRRGRWNLEILSDTLTPNSVTHRRAWCEVCQYPFNGAPSGGGVIRSNFQHYG